MTDEIDAERQAKLTPNALTKEIGAECKVEGLGTAKLSLSLGLQKGCRRVAAGPVGRTLNEGL